MYLAANRAGVVHMTAFTYRFAPAMRYLKHLTKSGALGEPRNFRSQRFLDLPKTHWGWRQYKAFAGAGDLFDMTIHRLDLGMDLLGPLHWICGAVARFAERDHPRGQGWGALEDTVQRLGEGDRVRVSSLERSHRPVAGSSPIPERKAALGERLAQNPRWTPPTIPTVPGHSCSDKGPSSVTLSTKERGVVSLQRWKTPSRRKLKRSVTYHLVPAPSVTIIAGPKS